LQSSRDHVSTFHPSWGCKRIFIFPARRARARAVNKVNQQCHFKSSRRRIDPLGLDSCRGTVPMELPMSNGSMRHREPKSEIDDTRMILQGASCTIAARRRAGHGRKYPIKGRQGFVPLSGTVGYGATVPRFRGGRSVPPAAPCSVIL
jgi:hypothetical protein